MKKILLILLTISFGVNIGFYIKKSNSERDQKKLISIFKINSSTYDEGFKKLCSSLESNQIHLNKKNVILVWDTSHCVVPKDISYLKELDSLFNQNHFPNTSLFYITEMNEEPISEFYKTHGIYLKNAKQLYDLDDYISGFCNLNKLKSKSKPTLFIIDSVGNVLYYYKHLIMPINEDTLLINNLTSPY